MAKDRMSWEQREELHEILHWINSPVTSPKEYMIKLAVKDFLNGVDPQQDLESRGTPGYIAAVMVMKARNFLQNERLKRRYPEVRDRILEKRLGKNKSREFTSENIRVTMDTSQDRNYGMSQSTIYCLVEVWTVADEELDKEYLINFSDFKTKEWLIRLLVWGLMNGREVSLKPATQEMMDSKTMFVPREKEKVA